MRASDFNFELPDDLIAQTPAIERDRSRLMILHRATDKVEHLAFRDILSFLKSGDVLVLNDSRVIPARLRGKNDRTGGRFELLLLEEVERNDWWAMVRPGKRARPGTVIQILHPDGKQSNLSAQVKERNDEGHRRVAFNTTDDILDLINALGEVPLPPYIRRNIPSEKDRTRYQTVFAKESGSVAAPTAGLHFTDALLSEIRSLGVAVCFLTLHVGIGTFAPVKAELLSDHTMHQERYHVSAETSSVINKARAESRRIIAVGTTTLRVLESADQPICPGHGRTNIFIYPPYKFKVVDALLTNFHLPRSTLLMLVSAFASPSQTTGRDLLLSAYAEAIRMRYRFFSYGDAMLLI